MAKLCRETSGAAVYLATDAGALQGGVGDHRAVGCKADMRRACRKGQMNGRCRMMHLACFLSQAITEPVKYLVLRGAAWMHCFPLRT